MVSVKHNHPASFVEFGSFGERTLTLSTGNGQAVIYVLVDPRDNGVRYVGTTTQPKARRSAHLSGKDFVTSKSVSAWVRELKAIGVLPSMYIVDTCPFVDSLRVEAAWIDRYGLSNLLNHGRSRLDRKPWSTRFRGWKASIGSASAGSVVSGTSAG